MAGELEVTNASESRPFLLDCGELWAGHDKVVLTKHLLSVLNISLLGASVAECDDFRRYHIPVVELHKRIPYASTGHDREDKTGSTSFVQHMIEPNQ